MSQQLRAKIVGTGSYTPSRIMTNEDFEKIVDTSDEWITTRTGIKERHIARDDEHTSDMSLAAIRSALEMSGYSDEDIDLVIIGTVTPDYRLPSAACVVQEKGGFKNAVAFDIVAACAGFINGVSIAESLIAGGRYKRAAVVGAEKLSAFTNYKDRNTCVLFGDAAGSVILEASDDGSGVLSTYMKSDGSMRPLLWAKHGGFANPITPEFAYDGTDKIYMNGSDIFKTAVREMTAAVKTVIDKAGLKPSDISLFVPHQANLRIIEAMIKRLKVSHDQLFLNIEKYGNTSAASVPLALDEANRAGRIKKGDYVCMVAFGGGLIWGANVVKW